MTRSALAMRLQSLLAQYGLRREAAAAALRAAADELDPRKDPVIVARVERMKAQLRELGHGAAISADRVRPSGAAVLLGKTEGALRVERFRGRGVPFVKTDGAVWYELHAIAEATLQDVTDVAISACDDRLDLEGDVHAQ